MSHFTLCFHEADSVVATEIMETLNQVNIQSTLLPSNDPGGEYLFERINQGQDKIVLLLSNDFLKDSSCLHLGLESIKSLHNQDRLLTIVIPSLETVDGVIQQTPTKIERIGDIIKFINHWQEIYLNIRKQMRDKSINEAEQNILHQELNLIRPISSEISEFLRLIKEKSIWYLEDLRNSFYQNIFEFIHKQEAHHGLKNFIDSTEFTPILAENLLLDNTSDEDLETIDENMVLANIPGMNLLTQNSSGSEASVQVLTSSEHPVSELDQEVSISEITEEKADETIQVEDKSNEQDFIHQDASKHLKNFVDTSEEEEATRVLDNEESNLEEEEVDFEADADDLLAKFIEKENQKFESTYLLQAIDLFERGLKEEAFGLIETGIKETQSGYAAIKWVDFLIEVNEQEEAYSFALDALKQDTFNEQLVYKIGQLELQKGMKEDAINRFEKVLSLDPAFKEVYYDLAVLIIECRPNNKTRALKLLKNAIKFNPYHPDAHYRIGLLLIEQFKELKKGVKALKKTLKLDPKHPFANYDLALHHFNQDHLALAKQYYLSAVENNEEFKTPENDKAFGIEPEDDTQDANTAIMDEVNQNLKDQTRGTVLITGATSGIGKATAYEFAAKNYRLILTGRRADRLESIQLDIQNQYKIPVETLVFDVRNYEEVQQALSNLDESWKPIDILVNNAGLARGLAKIYDGDIEHWDTMIDTNIKGVLHMSKIISKDMVKRGQGHIINVCSTAGKEVYQKGNVYCATKFAVDALTKAMRLDLYQDGIRVSQVSPAHVEETEFALVRFDQDADKAKIYEDFNPLTSRDVAETIYFIASRPAHVNIQDILVMGTQQAGSSHLDRSGRKYDN